MASGRNGRGAPLFVCFESLGLAATSKYRIEHAINQSTRPPVSFRSKPNQTRPDGGADWSFIAWASASCCCCLLEASPTSAAACCCALPPTRSARAPESCAGTISPGSGATQSRRGEVSSCAEAFLPSCDRRVYCPADFEPRASRRRLPLADAPWTPRADMDDIHHPPHPTGQAPCLGDDDAKGGAAAGGRTRGLDSGGGSGGGGRPGIKPSSGRTRVRTRLHACAVRAGVCGCVLARRSIDRLPVSANRPAPRT